MYRDRNLKAFKGHSLCVNTVAFSPDGKTLAAAVMTKPLSVGTSLPDKN